MALRNVLTSEDLVRGKLEEFLEFVAPPTQVPPSTPEPRNLTKITLTDVGVFGTDLSTIPRTDFEILLLV